MEAFHFFRTFIKVYSRSDYNKKWVKRRFGALYPILSNVKKINMLYLRASLHLGTLNM